MNKIIKDYNLKTLNTFQIDVKAESFIEIETVEDLEELISSNYLKENSYLILGGGSNILFTKNFDGLILKNRLIGWYLESEDDEYVYIKVASGTNWHAFVLECVSKNYGGIENLSLIPGSVGATPVQNIGAYGVELKDVFHSLEALDLNTGKTKIYNLEECQFGYRDSIFKRDLKGRVFISSVTLKLSKNPKVNYNYGVIKNTLVENGINPENASIKDISDAVIKIRTSKLPDPKVMGNGGSFFKNPVVSNDFFINFHRKFPDAPYYEDKKGKKIPAAWLIEQCGWKGKTVGNIGVHKNQPLVIVNYGDGKGNEIVALSENIKESVLNKFEINLEAEVNII